MVCLHPLKFRVGFTVPVLASEDKEGGSAGTTLFLCILFVLLGPVLSCYLPLVLYSVFLLFSTPCLDSVIYCHSCFFNVPFSPQTTYFTTLMYLSSFNSVSIHLTLVCLGLGLFSYLFSLPLSPFLLFSALFGSCLSLLVSAFYCLLFFLCFTSSSTILKIKPHHKCAIFKSCSKTFSLFPIKW